MGLEAVILGAHGVRAVGFGLFSVHFFEVLEPFEVVVGVFGRFLPGLLLSLGEESDQLLVVAVLVIPLPLQSLTFALMKGLV